MLGGVAVVEAGCRGPRKMNAARARLPRSGGAREQPARRVVHQHARAARVDGRPRAGSRSRRPCAARIGPRRRSRAAASRVQAVGADDEVEPARRGPFERDVDAGARPARGWRSSRRRGTPSRRGPPRGGSWRGRSGVAPPRRRFLTQPHGRATRRPPASTKVNTVTSVAAARSLGMMPIASATGQGGPAHVDGAAAGAQALRPLHDRGPEPVTGQPVGQGGAGDAGTGDEHGPRWRHATSVSRTQCRIAMSADLRRMQ